MTRRGARSPRRFSERRFHRWLADALRPGAGVALPIGDDAAAVRAGGHRVLLLTTDALTEGTHFLPGSRPGDLGRAAAAASLSDLAAKGGVPKALLLDLLIPPTTSPGWAQRVARSADRECARYGARLVGGDTKPALRPTVVGTLIGWGDDRTLAPRSGARPGDLLVTTGFVGRGGAAMAAFGRGKRAGGAGGRALLRIEPRVHEGQILCRVAHAMLDTSDGLAEAAHLLAEASRVRVAIDASLLPLAPALRGQDLPRTDAYRWAFYGGDYELLAALPPRALPALLQKFRHRPVPLTPVGRVEKGRGAYLLVDGKRAPLPRAGWDPFRASPP